LNGGIIQVRISAQSQIAVILAQALDLQAASDKDLVALADLSVCGGNGQGQNDNGGYNAKLQHDISILEYFYTPQNQACRDGGRKPEIQSTDPEVEQEQTEKTEVGAGAGSRERRG
jgi:hypothetical protein